MNEVVVVGGGGGGGELGSGMESEEGLQGTQAWEVGFQRAWELALYPVFPRLRFFSLTV